MAGPGVKAGGLDQLGQKGGSKPELSHLAKLIKDGKVVNVVVMAGAGISTAAGIPDFRSPETGLYSNLEKYQLPYPEAIFDIEYFVEHPQAFYTLAKELYPGNFKPTRTHYFFRLLKEKGILRTVFTQNIDTLERIAGLDDECVVEAHGSFAEAECLECKQQYTKEEIKPQIELGQVVYCDEKGCEGNKAALVKPKIVFFGEGMPDRFFSRVPDLHVCDLLIVMGTSLSVQPFASLIHRVPLSCPRLLMNLEAVGEAPRTPSAAASRGAHLEERQGFDFDGRTKRRGGIRDVLWLGSSDEGVKKLCEELGWEKELEEMWVDGWKKLDEQEEREKSVTKQDEVDLLVEAVKDVKLDNKDSQAPAKSIL